MVFKSVAYRMGYGKNVKGYYDGEKYILYYKTRDGVVNSKEIIRQAGRVDLVKRNEVFNATTVVPFEAGFVLSNKDKEIKSIVRGDYGNN